MEGRGKNTAVDVLPVSILGAGQGWLVAEKPAGLSVQGTEKPTLCSLLQSQVERGLELRDKIDFDPLFGIQPVHRLDRETSGVILLACRNNIFTHFAGQFEHRKVRKRYVALLHGRFPEAQTKDGWAIWSSPLSKDAGGRLHPEGTGRPIPCETLVRMIDQSDHYTLVECDLRTGRKHQIRRHACLAGHPVVGDERYGTPRSLRFLRGKMGFKRLALHSFSLEVQLPRASSPRLFQSPAIPLEILRLLEEDRNIKVPVVG